MTGLLFVVTAPSGAGKSSLIRRLLDLERGLALSVSYTTRPPRPGETNGREYHFVDPRTFEAMLERGEFLESAEVHGHRYGTSQAAINAERASAGARAEGVRAMIRGSGRVRTSERLCAECAGWTKTAGQAQIVEEVPEVFIV